MTRPQFMALALVAAIQSGPVFEQTRVMLILTHRFTPQGKDLPKWGHPLSLTATQRTRSRHRFTTDDGHPVHLQLPRGTLLQDGDWLTTSEPQHPPASATSDNFSGLTSGSISGLTPAQTRDTDNCIWVKILAKSEPILIVTAPTPLDLMRGAYHLGNRHVALEITPTQLRLSPDPVLEAMVMQLGLSVAHGTAPFKPEAGAYGSAPAHVHTRDHDHTH